MVVPSIIEGAVALGATMHSMVLIRYPIKHFPLRFDRARFRGGALIELTHPADEGHATTISFSKASFDSPVRIVDKNASKHATEFNFSSASGTSPVLLSSNNARVDLSESVLAKGSSFGAEATTDKTKAPPSMRIESVARAQLMGLVFESVDVSRCEFRDSYGLEDLRIAGDSRFCSVPKRQIGRRVTFDELRYRLDRSEGDAWGGANGCDGRPPQAPSPVPSAAHIESVYRSLRHAAEHNSDFAGASDFYFGEMQMRSRSIRTASPTKALIRFYGASSGYATHPPFASSLTLMMMFVAALFADLATTAGCADAADVSTKPERSVFNIARSVTRLFTTNYPCNFYEFGLAASTLITLVFLALTVLSVRSRVKR